MGMIASSDTSGQVDVAKMESSTEPEATKGGTGKQRLHLERHLSAMIRDWGQALRGSQRLYEGWRSLRSHGGRAWRFLRTRWTVTGIRVDNNPVWVAMTLIVVLLILLICLLSNWVYAPKYDSPFDFVHRAIGAPFNSAVHNRLLCSEKECDGNYHKPQSPIGDYLALEVVICFVTDSIERMLRRGIKTEKQIIQSRRIRPIRAGMIALTIILNFTLTAIASYGYLWPLPKEPSLKTYYLTLTIFVFGVGVARPCLGVHRSFPETPKLISDAIDVRREDLSKILKSYQHRKTELEEKIQRIEDKIDRIDSTYSLLGYLCACWRQWRLTVAKSRNFEPRNGLLHQVSGSMLIRLTIGGIATFVAHYMQHPLFVMQIVIAGAVTLFLMGCADSIAVSSGAFAVKSGKFMLATVNSLFLAAYFVTVYILNIEAHKGLLSGRQLAVAIIASLLLLCLVERVCLSLMFEGRDLKLASIVWIRLSLEFEIGLLQDRLTQKWPRHLSSSTCLSNTANRSSSWPPSHSLRPSTTKQHRQDNSWQRKR